MYFNRLITVLSFFLFISYFLFQLINKGLVNYDSNSYEKFEEMFCDSSYYQCIIIGNSRVHRNIDVQLLDSITRKKNYNAGIAGAGGYEIYIALRAFLKTHPRTKDVILNIDKGLLKNDKLFFNPSLYLNSFENKEIYNAFCEKGYPAFLYKWLPFTKMIEFNDDMRKNALAGLIGKEKTSNKNYHGYLPMQENIGKFDTIYSKTEPFDQAKEDYCYIDSIVHFCIKNELRLKLISTPGYNKHYYKKYSNYPQFINYIEKNYSEKFNIPFYILDTIPVIYNKNNFSDNIHFNIVGTQLFTKELGAIIK